MKNNFKARGFTLLELVMVVAIIAIISTLAVSRIGGLRDKAARNVSVANQQAISRAVETYLALNNGKLNRLDSLLDHVGTDPAIEGFEFDESRRANYLYAGPDASENVPEEVNSGLTPKMKSLLCLYGLSKAEKSALSDLGLNLVMRHATITNTAAISTRGGAGRGDDGVYLPAGVATDPDLSACVATAVTNAEFRLVAAVVPYTEVGRAVYRDCGYDLRMTKTAAEFESGREDTKAEVAAAGGPLIAFGLGGEASIVGAAEGGLESVPECSFPPSRYYRRYVLLFRLVNKGGLVKAYFAGTLDPCGQTVRVARTFLK